LIATFIVEDHQFQKKVIQKNIYRNEMATIIENKKKQRKKPINYEFIITFEVTHRFESQNKSSIPFFFSPSLF